MSNANTASLSGGSDKGHGNADLAGVPRRSPSRGLQHGSRVQRQWCVGVICRAQLLAKYQWKLPGLSRTGCTGEEHPQRFTRGRIRIGQELVAQPAQKTRSLPYQEVHRREKKFYFDPNLVTGKESNWNDWTLQTKKGFYSDLAAVFRRELLR
jgi:hypothetical protein